WHEHLHHHHGEERRRGQGASHGVQVPVPHREGCLMAKLAVINRQAKRAALVKKYAEKRKQLFSIINDPKATDEARDEARAKIQAMPRDASPVRLRNRCAITGRPRGTFRKFGLARNKIREIAMRGEIPGMIKASW